MKWCITKKKMINEMAKELAYLEIRADWYFYASTISDIEKRRDMSNRMLEYVTELRNICDIFGILEEVVDEAYKIYDFRNSGNDDFVPDVELIKKLSKEFCEPMTHKRVII